MVYHVISRKSGRQVGTFKTREDAEEYLKVIPFEADIVEAKK